MNIIEHGRVLFILLQMMAVLTTMTFHFLDWLIMFQATNVPANEIFKLVDIIDQKMLQAMLFEI